MVATFPSSGRRWREGGGGKTEGLSTLNQALIKGLPYCRQSFGCRAHFSAILPLLVLVKNFSMWNPSLDLACTGGGFTL